MKLTINATEITVTSEGDRKHATAIAEGGGYRCEAECDLMGRSYVTNTYCEGPGGARHNNISSVTDGTDAIQEAADAAASEVVMLMAAGRAGRAVEDLEEYSRASGVWEVVFADAN